MGIQYGEENGKRGAGLRVWDRPDIRLPDMAEHILGVRQMPAGPAKDARLSGETLRRA